MSGTPKPSRPQQPSQAQDALTVVAGPQALTAAAAPRPPVAAAPQALTFAAAPGVLTVAAAAPQVPLTLQPRGRPAAQVVAAVAPYNRCSAQALMSGEDSSEDTGEDRGGETTSARPPALVV